MNLAGTISEGYRRVLPTHPDDFYHGLCLQGSSALLCQQLVWGFLPLVSLIFFAPFLLVSTTCCILLLVVEFCFRREGAHLKHDQKDTGS